jgi:hypothetical protein
MSMRTKDKYSSKKSERRQKEQNPLRKNERRRGCKIKKIHQEVRENKIGEYGTNDTKWCLYIEFISYN